MAPLCATATGPADVRALRPLSSTLPSHQRVSPSVRGRQPRYTCSAASSDPSRVVPTSPERPACLVLDRRSVTAGAALSLASLALALTPRLAFAEGECELQRGGGGLEFCDLVVGQGYEAAAGDLIKAHYTGRLLNGTVFDTSYKRGRPLVFRVGVGEVIKGWDLGIVGQEGIPPMLAGGKRTLRIPAALAYGQRGAGCRGGVCAIPPNSDLIFEVELLGKA